VLVPAMFALGCCRMCRPASNQWQPASDLVSHSEGRHIVEPGKTVSSSNRGSRMQPAGPNMLQLEVELRLSAF